MINYGTDKLSRQVWFQVRWRKHMPPSVLNLAMKPGQNGWHNYFQPLNSEWWQADWARRSEFKALLNQCIYLNKTQNLMYSNIQNVRNAIQNCSAYKSKIPQVTSLNTQHTKWEFLICPEKRRSTDANAEVPQISFSGVSLT